MSPRLLASLALLILVAPRPARACLCTPPPTGQAGLARSIAVFEGTVLSLAQESFYTRARVKVMRRWKGPDVAELDVRTGGTGGACGHSFQAGQTSIDCAIRLTTRRPVARVNSSGTITTGTA